MSSVVQLESEISVLYKMVMRILFFMSSVAQVVAEISTYFHEGVGNVGPLVLTILIKM